MLPALSPPHASTPVADESASATLAAHVRARRRATSALVRGGRTPTGGCSVVDGLVYNVGHNVSRPFRPSKIVRTLFAFPCHVPRPVPLLRGDLMMITSIRVAAVLAAATVGMAPLAPASAQAPRASAAATDPGLARLEAEITRLATIAGGKVGVGAIHLETGRELFVNRG